MDTMKDGMDTMNDCNFYVCNAHHSTSVKVAAKGRWTTKTLYNLVIAKGSSLEVCQAVPDGLEPIRAVPFYGTIAALVFFRPISCVTDHLFLLLERLSFAVLRVDPRNQELCTISFGNLFDPNEQIAERGPFLIADPYNRVLIAHIYTGSLQVMNINPNGTLNTRIFKIMLYDRNIFDIGFFHTDKCPENPQIGLIHQRREGKLLKTYSLGFQKYCLQDGPMPEMVLNSSASILIPMRPPLGGAVLVVSTENLIFKTAKHTVQYEFSEHRNISAWCHVEDTTRLLLGDTLGRLWVVTFVVPDPNNLSPPIINMIMLGNTSIPNSLVYLDNGILYVGSQSGDSQIVRLLPEKKPDTLFLEVIEKYENLGPITDLITLKNSEQTCNIVCTSGSKVDTSLRVARNGIGFAVQFRIPLSGVCNMWSLKTTDAPLVDRYLVLGTATGIRILEIKGNDMTEQTIPGLVLDVPTLWLSNTLQGVVVQVTEQEVRLFDIKAARTIGKWTCQGSHRIQVVACWEVQVVLGCSGGMIVYLEIKFDGGIAKLEEKAYKDLGSDATAISICGSYIAVSLWRKGTVLFQLPWLEILCQTPDDSKGIARSVVLQQFGPSLYLILGLDGRLQEWQLLMYRKTTTAETPGREARLVLKKEFEIGTLPVSIYSLSKRNRPIIIAVSDRAVIVRYESNRNVLSYTNVSLGERVDTICSLYLAGKDSTNPKTKREINDLLCVITNDELVIGVIDLRSNLQVQKLDVGMSAWRLAHSEDLGMYMVSFQSQMASVSGREQVATIVLYDSQTLEQVHSHSFKKSERLEVLRVLDAKFSSDEEPYFIVSVARIISQEREPTFGKILVYCVENRKLVQLEEVELKGMAWSIRRFRRNFILVGVTDTLFLYEWKPSAKQRLNLVTSVKGQCMVYDIKTFGDKIVVGDMLTSVAVYKFNPETRILEEYARDINRRWVTCCEMVTEELILGADNRNNLFAMKPSSVKSENESYLLKLEGQFHLGDRVNKICKGSLSDESQLFMNGMPNLEERFGSSKAMNKMLFGTVSGAIGCIFQLDPKRYKVLKQIEEAIGAHPGVGSFEFTEWRSAVELGNVSKKCHGFIDGNLVETFFMLPREQRASIAKMVKIREEVIGFLVECMMRKR